MRKDYAGTEAIFPAHRHVLAPDAEAPGPCVCLRHPRTAESEEVALDLNGSVCQQLRGSLAVRKEHNSVRVGS